MVSFTFTAISVNCQQGGDIYILSDTRVTLYSFCAFAVNGKSTVSFMAGFVYVQFRVNNAKNVYALVSFNTTATSLPTSPPVTATTTKATSSPASTKECIIFFL
jgi:hypothetical protein